MVSQHPNKDIQIVKINTITLFHEFFEFLKFGKFEVSTLYSMIALSLLFDFIIEEKRSTGLRLH